MKQLLTFLAAFSLAWPLQAGTAHPAIGPADALPAASRAEESTLRGVVVETMDASRYTYVLLDTESVKVWVAANLAEVKAGDHVEVLVALPMDNFYSRTLDRTFDKIYFASSIHPAGHPEKAGYGKPADPAAYALPPGHPEIPYYHPSTHPKAGGLPAGHPEVTGYGKRADLAAYELPPGHPEAPGKRTGGNTAVTALEPFSGGKTVAEVYSGKSDLAGQVVAVRGKVIKVNDGILGRNWIHLKDGSGEPGTDDLTVTSEDQTARVGDTVVARGVVGLDRDFGGGYFYTVLLEDATLDVE